METLEGRFGNIPAESGLKRKMRLHQGWWRTNVLNQKPGLHPKNKQERICNILPDGRESKSNFLTESVITTVEQTLRERKEQRAGLMEEERLYNNLLSSQPLCFNFFGELSVDCEFGLSVLKCYYPNLTKLRRVIFEYAPAENYTRDHSAFDVAFEVESEEQSGLIGWECKYTDSLSPIEYDKESYRQLYAKSSSFSGGYDELKKSRTNQLFRNQLIAEGLLQNRKYDFVYTGLFCFQEDMSALELAAYFKSLLSPSTNFQIVTYADFIAKIQAQKISWEKREWSMLLWARYCATVLSDPTIRELEKRKTETYGNCL